MFLGILEDTKYIQGANNFIFMIGIARDNMKLQ